MRFPKFLLSPALIIMLLLPCLAQSAALDQKRIHSQYNEGDFDAVVSQLEAFKQRNPSYSRTDSIFVAKHLAVVYSANPNTREKGKYYMNMLLELLPSAKLVDMYVSDEIDRIFEKVREEFLARQTAFGVDTTQLAVPRNPPRSQPQPQPEPARPVARADRREKSNAGYWVAGGAAVVAVGVAAYFIFNTSEAPPDKYYDVQ